MKKSKIYCSRYLIIFFNSYKLTCVFQKIFCLSFQNDASGQLFDPKNCDPVSQIISFESRSYFIST